MESQANQVIELFKNVPNHNPPQDVKTKWDSVVQNAKNYKFAEQGGTNFKGVFTNWPNSKYKMPGEGSPLNNSNTFIRTIVSESGLTMIELDGEHPGTNKPVPVKKVYGTDPWKKGSTPPPQPTSKP